MFIGGCNWRFSSSPFYIWLLLSHVTCKYLHSFSVNCLFVIVINIFSTLLYHLCINLSMVYTNQSHTKSLFQLSRALELALLSHDPSHLSLTSRFICWSLNCHINIPLISIPPCIISHCCSPHSKPSNI